METEKITALIEKLKGKSVYRNLLKVSKGRGKGTLDEVIGISSLLTHALIECKTDISYKEAVNILYVRLGELIEGTNLFSI